MNWVSHVVKDPTIESHAAVMEQLQKVGERRTTPETATEQLCNVKFVSQTEQYRELYTMLMCMYPITDLRKKIGPSLKKALKQSKGKRRAKPTAA